MQVFASTVNPLTARKETAWNASIEVFRAKKRSKTGRCTKSQGCSDLTGVFCTSGSEREFTLEERGYADEEVQAGADRDTAAAG